MARTIHTSVPSVALFQQFTSDLIKLKQQALAPEPRESTTLDLQPEAEGGPAVLVSRANAIWNKVLVLLDQQTIAAIRIAGPAGLEFHREAIYVMAVLADEIFVHSEWEGRDYWLNRLLEARLFQTHAAGEIFFRRLVVASLAGAQSSVLIGHIRRRVQRVLERVEELAYALLLPSALT